MRAIKTTTISILAIGLLAGSAVGVVAQDDAPAFFSWTFADFEDAEVIDGTFEEPAPGFVKLYGDMITGLSIVADDARASGLWSIIENKDDVFVNQEGDPDEEQVLTLSASSQRLVNDDGSWSGTGTSAHHGYQLSDEGFTSVAFAVLTGEDSYEGLTLVLASSGEESWGWIVPNSSVPPVPELPAE